MLLPPRLAAIAALIPPAAIVADIGTDHAFLPLYLIQTGRCSQVLAVELNPGPLEAAKRNVYAAGLQGSIRLFRGNGLEPLTEEVFEVVVVTGMGGRTVQEILSRYPVRISRLQRLVIQPNNSVSGVRKFLLRSGFRIVAEDLVLENNRFYEIIAAEPGDSQPLEPVALEVGPMLMQQRHPLLPVYLEARIEVYRRILAAIVRSQKHQALRRKEEIEQQMLKLEKVKQWLLDVRK